MDSFLSPKCIKKKIKIKHTLIPGKTDGCDSSAWDDAGHAELLQYILGG